MTAIKKRISFNEAENTVHENELTIEDLQPQHYSLEELEIMKRQVLLAVDKVRRGGRKVHTRGLEHFLETNAEFNSSQRKDFVRQVVDLYQQQDDKQSLMEEEDNPVRQYSMSKTRSDKREAVKRANQDETEAAKVYKEDKMVLKRRHSKTEQTRTFVVALVNGIRPRGRRMSRSAQ